MLKIKLTCLTFYSLFIMLITTALKPFALLFKFLCDAGIEVEYDRVIIKKKLGLSLTQFEKKFLNREGKSS